MLKNIIHRLLRDRRGNVSAMFGLALIPVVGLIGAAVDYSRANAVRVAIQAALDSTALAMAASASTLSASDLQTQGLAYFNALFTRTDATGTAFTITYTMTATGPQVTASASTTVKMKFMNLPKFGISQIPVAGSSTTAWGNSRLRVALVLDNTGSMQDDGKIGALKTATNNLLTQLHAAATNNGDVYVSIIPFADDVNVGTTNYNQNWIDWTDWNSNNQTCSGFGWNQTCNAANHNTWNGCVTDRGNSNTPSSSNWDQTITAPNGTSASQWPADQDGNCPQQMMGLNYNWTTMTSLVNAMSPGGSTNQPIGLVWGWQSLVGGAQLSAPAMDPNYTYSQVIILLSDGLNTQDRWYGNGSSTSTQVDSRMYKTSDGSGTCANIKAAGITIYAIQVNTGGDPTSTLLQNCASDSSHFFMLTSSSQIVTTFQQIGTKLSKLRVAK